MWEDPIVAEVREIRANLAAKFGFDVKAIFADLRKRQGSRGGRLILQTKRAEPSTAADGIRVTDSAEPTNSDATPAT